MSSAHLSRVLSPVKSTLIPSLLAERVSLNFPPAFDAVGVTGVEGVAAADELAAFLAAESRRDKDVDVHVCVKKRAHLVAWPRSCLPMHAFPAQPPFSTS